jgi:CheY-like chemotaxis protein/predicted regulator of Ras-like GTPase activity (Roadblock/LC7/MglB family)
MIAPGKNPVLQYVARQMNGLADVVVLASANELLWRARQTPPRIVLTDVQLEDMSGAELAEILPNFAPNTRILICGQPHPTVVGQAQAVGAEFVALDGSAAQSLEAVYRALDMAPPTSAPPAADPAALESPAPRGKTPETRVVAPTIEVVAPAARPAAPESARPAPAPRPAPVSAVLSSAREAAAATNGADAFNASGALVIQPQQHQVLTRLLDLVGKEVGAACVLLIDPAGMVLVQSGGLTNVVLEMVGPLLATSFSTTSQLARHLQEQNTNATYIHEGDRYDIYAFNVSYRVSLVIIFDKRTNPGKLGTVWVYAKRAMRQLEQILKL